MGTIRAPALGDLESEHRFLQGSLRGFPPGALLLLDCPCMNRTLASIGMAALLAACEQGPQQSAGDPQDFWAATREDEGDDAARTGDRQVRIEPGPTDHAERVETVAVGRSEEEAERRVVLHLGPGQLPGLARGDRLIVPVEVQATTRCDVGQDAPGCNYNPSIRVQVLLSGRADDTSGSGSSRVLATQTQTCTRADHHCMFVFGPESAAALEDGPPCVGDGGCHVNVAMWAWHPDARAGGADKVLVGGNDGDYLENGRVEGDLARVMAVRERGLAAADRPRRETSGSGAQDINTRAEPEIIYSHRLKAGDLAAGEQFLIEARLVTTVSDRARVSSQLVVSRRPDGTGNGVGEIAPGAIGEHNGINCTAGTSPCTTRKAAVLRVTGAISGPVYVNLIVKSAVPGPGGASVSARRGDGWVRSVRYAAALGR